jgi:hypothetical protein
MNPLSATDVRSSSLGDASPTSSPPGVGDDTELSIDELDIVCGGLARVWTGPADDQSGGQPSTLLGPTAS